MLNWSNELLSQCYDFIQFEGHPDPQLIQILKDDLSLLLVVPPKEEAAKQKLIDNKDLVEFSTGDKFELNSQFIEGSILLSNELGLNELVCPEVLYYANQASIENGIGFIDSGKQEFFKRYQYILNILGYLIVNKKLELVISDFNLLQDNLVKSFEIVYKILNNLEDMINKQSLTTNNNLSELFVNSCQYTKLQLFQCHELLGEIYYNLIEHYFEKFGSISFYNKILAHLYANVSDNDCLILHYYPGMLNFINNLSKLNEPDVIKLHLQTVSKLSQDFLLVSSANVIELSNSKLKQYEVLLSFLFLTNLIPWCKSTHNLEKFNFNDDILSYIQICLNYGVLENLLRFTSESTHTDTFKLFELNNLCDFKYYLQRTFPPLTFEKFTYNSIESFAKLNLEFNLSATFRENLLPYFWHTFFINFITNVAIVLTKLRDSEEDYLLSSINRLQKQNSNLPDVRDNDSRIGMDDTDNRDPTTVNLGLTRNAYAPSNSSNSHNTAYSGYNQASYNDSDLDLDEIYSRADLERFYLSFVYTYKFRDTICGLLWENEDTNGDMIGFIMWGVNNNSSPLITATFCLLLSSLTTTNNKFHATTKIFESLVVNNSNLKKTDYSKISIDSITDSLNYYLNALNENFELDLNNQVKQRQKRQEFLFSNGESNSNNQENASNQITIELAEDSLIFITGFTLLMSSIVGNLGADDDDERSKDIRMNLFKRFKPIITGFLKFDNMIINLQQTSKANDLSMVTVNGNNRSILLNLMFEMLVNFNHAEVRYEIWEVLDKWMFHKLLDNDNDNDNRNNSGSQRDHYMNSHSQMAPNHKIKFKHSINIKSAFKMNLLNLSNITNFVQLTNQLLTPMPSSPRVKLLYPLDLGYTYRANNHVGIWPYIEFIILDVLSNSNKITHEAIRVNLQHNLLDLILKSIDEIDWRFYMELLPNLSSKPSANTTSAYQLLIEDIPFSSLIKLHHSVSIINYLYDEKAYKAIFSIIGNEEDDDLVLGGIKVVKKLLELQDIFKQLIPILKNNDEPKSGMGPQRLLTHTSSTNSLLTHRTSSLLAQNYSIYYPSNFNLIDFQDILSTNISLIINIGLLIGCNNEDIIEISLDLLNSINDRFYQTNEDDNLLIKNKLLTIFMNCPESNKLKYGIINQFNNSNFNIKLNLLKFFIKDLSNCNGMPCCSHYLLGYEIKGNYLLLNSDNNLLRNIVDLLMVSLNLISSMDYNSGINIIELNYIQLTSLILKVLITLCQHPISSVITLNYLRDFDHDTGNLFERLLTCQPKIDHNTIWNSKSFNADLNNNGNQFIYDKSSIITFFEFFKSRILILQYLTLEFHNLSQTGSIYKKHQYLKTLMNDEKFLNESNKILNFLDILNFNFKDFETFNYQKFNDINLNLILHEIKHEDNIYDDEKLLSKNNEMIKLYGSEEVNNLKDYLVKFIINDNLNNLQLAYLHHWVQLIEVIINDADLPKADYQSFILQILSSILPKINDYFETPDKIIFSEELISLCVILIDNDYYKEQGQENKDHQDELFTERLLLLFSTCIKGVISNNSTINLRNDLYIIMNNFLQKSFTFGRLLTKLMTMLENIDIKFLEIICNDSIVNEGSIRIVSLILLESIIHLFNHFDNKYVINQLIHNNSLLLIIRSLKRIDEILDTTENDNVATILYELINFKSINNLLIRIGQIRDGSAYLIQSELFSIIKQFKILKIDPELGINLKIDELNKVNLSLDSNLNFINYYEFLLPIFKLISILLISMGPNYKPSKIQGKNLLVHFNDLRNSIIKKDILIKEKNLKYNYQSELNELMNQFVLIESLVE